MEDEPCLSPRSQGRTDTSKELQLVGFCWWSSGKNLPANAADMGVIPGWGTKIPQAAEPLNPRTTYRNHRAHALEPVLPTEATTIRSWCFAPKE